MMARRRPMSQVASESDQLARFANPSPESGAHPSQRREHSRVAVELDVSLGSDHNFYAGFAENVSAGGLFIATHMLQPVGERIEFRVNLPGASNVVRGLGEVRWVRDYCESSNVPPGMGLRFINLAPGSEELIAEFLAQRDPIFFDD
jgi:uncharacterized protein (TIGR02266 family)